MAPDFGQKTLDVGPRIKMQEGVEGAGDQIELLGEPSKTHVTRSKRDAAANGLRLTGQPGFEIPEHGPRKIEPGNEKSLTRQRERDPPIAHAILEHRRDSPASSSVLLGDGNVECDVVGASLVSLRVVGRVF